MKPLYKILGLAVVLGAVVISGKMATAEVSVGVNLNFGFPIPQEVVLAPGGVYYVSNPGVNVFFHSGYWWTPRGNIWYRSRDYSHGWVVVEPSYVPMSVINVYQVPNYRVVYKEKGRHIPYGQWKKQGYQIRAVERDQIVRDSDEQLKFDKPMKHDKHGGRGKKGNHGRGN